ncbi:hypothetical protein J2X77_001544 [Sphingobacterium sp. 2149]|nr:hypothetical protein [Sphingobacterium sp. 2149]
MRYIYLNQFGIVLNSICAIMPVFFLSAISTASRSKKIGDLFD